MNKLVFSAVIVAWMGASLPAMANPVVREGTRVQDTRRDQVRSNDRNLRSLNRMGGCRMTTIRDRRTSGTPALKRINPC